MIIVMATTGFMNIEDVNAKLDEGLKAIFEENRFQELLHLMSKFPNYSLNNMLLIAQQMPHATMVMGYKGWQELGRQVSKGEKGIKILAPIFKKVEKEKIDPETNEVVRDEKGNIIKEKKDILVGFRNVSVFDISQTTGKEIPSPRDIMSQRLKDGNTMKELYQDFFNHILKTESYDLKEQETDSGVGGYFKRDTNEIVISTNNNKNESEKFRVLVHEYAHAKLHHKESPLKDLPRGHKEAQAESVAYIVCNYYGLEIDGESLGYIATWAKDIKLARQAMEEVQEVADSIISQIDELQRDKVLEIYQSSDKEYLEAKEFLKNQFDVIVDEVKKEEGITQFELLNKKYGYVVSARLEESDKTEKLLFKTERNMIIGLSDITPNGDYIVLNKELENSQISEIEAYKRIPEIFEVNKIDDGKYAVTTIAGMDLVSKVYTNKVEAEKEYLRMAISQSLHQQSFLKSQLNNEKADMNVEKLIEDNKIQVNIDVANFLSHGQDKMYTLKGNEGTTIGWELLKNKEIQSLEDLKTFAFVENKHLKRYEPLRTAIENTIETSISKPEPEKLQEEEYEMEM